MSVKREVMLHQLNPPFKHHLQFHCPSQLQSQSPFPDHKVHPVVQDNKVHLDQLVFPELVVQVCPAQLDHPETKDHPDLTDFPAAPAQLDLQAHKDHPVPLVPQDHKDQLDQLEKLELQDNPEVQEPQDMMEPQVNQESKVFPEPTVPLVKLVPQEPQELLELQVPLANPELEDQVHKAHPDNQESTDQTEFKDNLDHPDQSSLSTQAHQKPTIKPFPLQRIEHHHLQFQLRHLFELEAASFNFNFIHHLGQNWSNHYDFSIPFKITKTQNRISSLFSILLPLSRVLLLLLLFFSTSCSSFTHAHLVIPPTTTILFNIISNDYFLTQHHFF
jgi:hypothetical protein